ncbi:50S ribosomal protein L13 [Coxiella endosymbiont of Ornithodoros amblus]|uniref:50S ribosomal protein L13 n=1 Tax=Coxiella endosymbiont of Ornithodoros amblus TaxID=1656166 RepID=UPI00244E2886|nr:50S ribosomal protein L13 [Coxiella endosymbiont of Ornithodoros amblus]MBW5802974.1 50S ribosomal protein L13 [Coxiella endosymbiont of Ornithodoros amblus]
MATYMANAKTVSPRWLLVNAEGKTLGRLASRIAEILRAKHKAEFTPHVDAGDFVVVINVDKLKVTGNKTQDKQYYHHSGYPGGLKTISFADLQAKKPHRILELAIKGMLPKGPLGRQLYRKLKIYAGDYHPHQAQQPELIDL